MENTTKLSSSEIVAARKLHPKMRERDFALAQGISEGDFIAAYIGAGDKNLRVCRVKPDLSIFLDQIGQVGEVMALTRNASVVHEKIGTYEKTVPGRHAAMVLGDDIDLRMFPKHFVDAFAVEKITEDEAGSETKHHSLQFFDAFGDAVHKVHLREQSNLHAYEKMLEALSSDEQEPAFKGQGELVDAQSLNDDVVVDLAEFHKRWAALTDVHQFVMLLRDFKIDRKKAVELAAGEFTWKVEANSVATMMSSVAQTQLPIMCFVGSRGCIQIHTGPIENLKDVGHWINVLDAKFHMHLRGDHIAEVWVVRKPTTDGFITSMEVFDAQGELIIQFFGQRQEGTAEREDWRDLVAELPRARMISAS